MNKALHQATNSYANSLSEARIPAGPTKIGRMLSLFGMRSKPVSTVSSLLHRYGQVVQLDRAHYLIGDPDLAELILSKTPSTFEKLIARPQQAIDFWGTGLVMLEGEDWLRQRRILQPVIQHINITSTSAVIATSALDLLQAWKSGEARELYNDLMHITFGIMTKTIFSNSISISENNELLSAIESTFVLFDNTDQLATSFSTAEKRKFHDQIQSMDSIIYRVIEHRRANELGHKDTLAVLIKLQDVTGELLSNQQIRDEIVALLRSGHKNNATTLAWVFYLLAEHPQTRLQLEAELAEALDGRPPTSEDLPKLGYAQMVIKEAMRLYPLYPLINRYAVQDCELGKYHIPSGARLTISQWDLHRSPRYFDHPEEFNPGRWTGDLGTNLPKFVYLPFSAGARRCPFKTYAMMEMTLILAMIVQQFRIELLPHSHVKPQFSPNGLYPKDGLPVVVYKRPS